MLLLLVIAGCVRNTTLDDMTEDAAWQRLDAIGQLQAVGWVRGQADVGHIYIEGDGVAYSTPTALLLAHKDNAPSVAYLSRPFQYVSDAACTGKHWTTERFPRPHCAP
jgi:hypothetical protein